MRLLLLTVGIIACWITLVAGWEKEDHEIFRLKHEVESSEGPGVSFYDFLEVEKTATQDDIIKAFRKRSQKLHPDKVKRQFIADKSTGKDKKKAKGSKKKPGVHVSKGPSDAEIKAAAQAATDRYARLGVVRNVLTGAGRARYDHFLENGFPTWKGTGYYYDRFRPGLGTVLAGLFIFVGGGGHWLALYMSWLRQQDFVNRYIKFARHAAWGDNLGIPGLDGVAAGAGTATPPVATDDENGPMNRRQRRMQEKDSRKDKSEKKTKGIKAARASPSGTPPVGATGPRKRVQAENGKILVVDSVGNVYLEQQDEDGRPEHFLLDPNELPRPTIKDTALYRLPIWAYGSVVARFHKKAPSDEEFEDGDDDDEVASSSSGAGDYEVLDPVKTSAPNGNGRAVRRNKKTGKGR